MPCKNIGLKRATLVVFSVLARYANIERKKRKRVDGNMNQFSWGHFVSPVSLTRMRFGNDDTKRDSHKTQIKYGSVLSPLWTGQYGTRYQYGMVVEEGDSISFVS